MWDREDLKIDADIMEELEAVHSDVFALADAVGPTKSSDQEATHYAPAVLKMRAVSEDFFGGDAELENKAHVGIWRNVVLKDQDEDKVSQRAEPVESESPETPESPQDGKMPKTGDVIIGWLPWIALATVLATAAGVTAGWRRMRNGEHDEKIEEEEEEKI